MQMKKYQLGIKDFTENESLVFGISTDEVAKSKEFAESLDLQFVLLSDPEGKVAADYGVLMSSGKMAKRVTFVIGQDGKVAFVGEGGDAMDATAAASACGQLK